MFKKFKNINIIIIFIFFFNILTSIAQANKKAPFNNIAVHDKPMHISSVIFEDIFENKLKLENLEGNLVILNFWATWCAPCKEEMPSLDKLSYDKNFKNLKILAVNMEKKNLKKTQKFFSDLGIKKLPIYFGEYSSFVKKLKLRGVPTTILINPEGKEFARIIGSIDVQDKDFLKWLSNYE